MELCGRDAVLVRASNRTAPAFAEVAARLRPLGEVLVNEFVLRFRTPPYELTLFPDGRTVVKGTQEPALARSLVARYVGV